MNIPDLPDDIDELISGAMLRDRHRLRRLLRNIRQAARRKQPIDRNRDRLLRLLEESSQLRRQRAARVPSASWPEDLPVTARRSEIAAAIRDNQVVIICGETGSGKSTQLPKIALDLGRGVDGVIGHTQPRRIAARAVASRVAEELGCSLGEEVGYRIRFTDSSGPTTLIRLMTDGIMLAETQSDRFLEQYDTIIVDEAHERSLNIDFLLGYLKRLLPKRPELRVIVTSATIDAERFADHFSAADGTPAPILIVEGRTYPVDIRYPDPTATEGDDEDRDWLKDLESAVAECTRRDDGHILCFLPTERDIREAAKRVEAAVDSRTEVVTLFGRLSMADQAKVFRPTNARRIVLATNVAESSLTVPGIRYVIDTGTARISRYSSRTRIQRLPVEPVSQASANQRAGRCGRVGPGICYRLYSREDFESREPFTPAEILRTNLASVILRTLHLKLGRLDKFPFIDPPRQSSVREGYQTLEELGAIEVGSHSAGDPRLTDIGRQMARMPVDPRISRIILAAVDEQALAEVLIIVSALEIQDPRERPLEKQQAADEAHAVFRHEDSDFLSLLNLWDAWHKQKKELSNSGLKKWCRSRFLSWMRMREWMDIHRQLRDLLRDSGDKSLREAAGRLKPADRRNDYQAVHRSLIAGLLANLAYRPAEQEFTGAGGQKLFVWPGSALFRKPPKWFVAAELVETTRRFARTIARIQPEWIEPIAAHLVKREYFDPHWNAAAGNVSVFEKVSLWGLPLVARRRVPLARVDPVRARELLIRFGMVELGLLYGSPIDDTAANDDFEEEAALLLHGNRSRITPGRTFSGTQAAEGERRPGPFASEVPYLRHNAEVLKQLLEHQQRSRRTDIVPTDEVLTEFYGSRVPQDVSDRQKLKRWYRRTVRNQPELLKLRLEDFLEQEHRERDADLFPQQISLGGRSYPVTYQLDPGRDHDGMTVTVSADQIGTLDVSGLVWLVPGLLEQKVLELIRSLPRDYRRYFVPAPDTAAAVTPQLKPKDGSLFRQLAEKLTRIAGDVIRPEWFSESRLPNHLRCRLRITDAQGKETASGLNAGEVIAAVREQQAAMVREAAPSAEEQQWHRKGFTGWTFSNVPIAVDLERGGVRFRAWPAVRDDETSVGLTLCGSAEEADAVHHRGIRRLVVLSENRRIRRQVDNLPSMQEVRLAATTIRGLNLSSRLILLMADRAWLGGNPAPAVPRTAQQFEDCLGYGRKRLGLVTQEIVQLLPPLMKTYLAVRRELDELPEAGPGAVAADIRRHLKALMVPDFLSETPWPWLLQFTRYLSAMRQRIRRAGSGGLRTEQELMEQLAPFEQRYLNLPQSQQAHPMAVHYRWMLEEYRVSLFAQKLGTAITVSPRKLDEHWQRVPH